jgi:hypothetical protein
MGTMRSMLQGESSRRPLHRAGAQSPPSERLRVGWGSAASTLAQAAKTYPHPLPPDQVGGRDLPLSGGGKSNHF